MFSREIAEALFSPPHSVFDNSLVSKKNSKYMNTKSKELPTRNVVSVIPRIKITTAQEASTRFDAYLLINPTKIKARNKHAKTPILACSKI